jgi:hypothetical protein
LVLVFPLPWLGSRACGSSTVAASRAWAEEDEPVWLGVGEALQVVGQVADADTRVEQAEQESARARQAEPAAITRAEHAQAAAADETARIRADHQRSLDQLTTRGNQRLAEELTQTANAEADTTPTEAPAPRSRTANRTLPLGGGPPGGTLLMR